MCGVHSTGKWIGLSAGIVAGFAVLAGLAPQNKKDAEQPKSSSKEKGLIGVGDKAPDFSLKDPAGKDHSLKDLKGSVVVLDFWATWCGPCKKAMPSVQKIHDKYKDNKNVRVYGVNTWEQSDPAQFMRDKKYTYGLLLRGDDVAKAYGVAGIPAFFVIGPDGKVLMSETGFDPGKAAEFEKKVSDLIDGALSKKS